MVLYCSAFGCSNANADPRRYRHFLWTELVKRRRADFSAKMVICSDHFFDECYENSAFLKSKLMPHEKRLQIPSIPDALLNTDLKSKEFREHFQLK